MTHLKAARLILLSAVILLTACGGSEPAVLTDAEPAAGETLNQSPNSLRLYFTSKPDVANSELHLTGPNGEVSLVGLHTMGANDLMIGINDYPLANGEYTVQWQLVLLDTGETHSGEYRFEVATSQP